MTKHNANNNIIDLDRYADRKSFNWKAYASIDADGGYTLYSYGTRVLRYRDGYGFRRVWDGWSATTQRHIKAFCAFVGDDTAASKAGFTDLKVVGPKAAAFPKKNAA